MKILIHLPGSEKRIFNALPLLHKLFEEFQAAQVNLIVDPGNESWFLNFPFDLNIYSWDQSKYGGLSGAHKFAYNLKDVFNINIFISLEPTLKSAFLGYCFRAELKLGIQNGLNVLFLDNKIKNSTKTEENKFLELLSLLTSKKYEYEDFLGKKIGEKSPLNQEYILIIIEKESDLFGLDDYLKFYNVIIAKPEGLKLPEYVRSHNKILGEVSNVDIKTILTLISWSNGVVSSSPSFLSVALYLDIPILVFGEKFPELENFKNKPVPKLFWDYAKKKIRYFEKRNLEVLDSSEKKEDSIAKLYRHFNWNLS